jgi:hypothetical protein
LRQIYEYCDSGSLTDRHLGVGVDFLGGVVGIELFADAATLRPDCAIYRRSDIRADFDLHAYAAFEPSREVGS